MKIWINWTRNFSKRVMIVILELFEERKIEFGRIFWNANSLNNEIKSSIEMIRTAKVATRDSGIAKLDLWFEIISNTLNQYDVMKK